MATYRLTIRIPFDSGLPEDLVVNVFHCTAPDLAGAEDFAANVVGFYQVIDQYFSAFVNNGANACSWQLYNLADPEPRAPNSEGNFGLPDATGVKLPPELSVCLSFQGDRISGQPQRHRRGRVFLGPMDSSANQDGLVDPTVQNGIRDAADDLVAASGTWDWVVYSPTLNSTVLITNGWVDNAWDIQRRRGVAATTRLLWGPGQ